MQEAKSLPFLRRERAPVLARFLEEREGADHVGLNELRRPDYRTVDVAFRREIDDSAGLVLPQQPAHRLAVADIGAHENVTRLVPEARQAGKIARVGELVDIDDRICFCREPLQDEIGADEPGAARYEYQVDVPR